MGGYTPVSTYCRLAEQAIRAVMAKCLKNGKLLPAATFNVAICDVHKRHTEYPYMCTISMVEH